MNKPKILVAGANGLNGRSLLEKLSVRGIPARAMVRNTAHALTLQNETTEIVEADLANMDSLKKALVGIDLAYIVTSIHPDSVSLFNNFFMAAKDANVQHVIKLSGLGATADSKSEILRQHFLSDELLIGSGLNFTIIQPNSFFQNILWQKRSIRIKGRLGMLLADGKQSYIDARDVAEATVQIFKDKKHLNKIYQLTGPGAISGNDIASELSDMLNKQIKYKPISSSFARQEMLAGGVSEWNSIALTEIQEVFAAGTFAETTDDLEFILSKKPRNLRCFLEDCKTEFL
jgi:uncharacterized protein YbjT (DUF2867 family)